MKKYLRAIRMTMAGIAFLAILPALYLRTEEPESIRQVVMDKAATGLFVVTVPLWLSVIVFLGLSDPVNYRGQPNRIVRWLETYWLSITVVTTGVLVYLSLVLSYPWSLIPDHLLVFYFVGLVAYWLIKKDETQYRGPSK